MRRLLLTIGAIAMTMGVATAATEEVMILSPGADYSLYVQGMSNNGRWLAGYYGSTSCLIDTETETYYNYLYESDFNSVSNAGVMAGWAVLEVDDGETSAVLVGPNDYTKVYPNDENCSAMAKAITADGAVVCGFTYNNSTRVRQACIWKGDERIDLPNPEGLAFATKRGTAAQFISDDAKIIVGYVVYGASYPCIIWRLQDDGTYACDPLCNRFFNSDTDADDQTNEWYQLMPEGLSKNGRYISLLLVDENGWWVMGRYNTETDELTASDTTYDYWPEHVSDQGSIAGWRGYDEYYGAVVWREGDDSVAILAEEYGLSTLADYDDLGTNRAVCITPSGRYIAGVAVAQFDVLEEYARDFAWWVDLGEDEEGYIDGIKQIDAQGTTTQASALTTRYNLAGQRLSPTAKGLIIENHKKILR